MSTLWVWNNRTKIRFAIPFQYAVHLTGSSLGASKRLIGEREFGDLVTVEAEGLEARQPRMLKIQPKDNIDEAAAGVVGAGEVLVG